MRFLKKLILWTFVLGLLVSAIGLGGGIYFYFQLTKDLPQIAKISDYEPKAVTTLYADDGTLIAEVFDENGGRRYPVPFSEIPLIVRQAFLAAEDANFYQHPGIDIQSIIRALVVNLQRKGRVQGASTITQQLVKSLLLSREKTYTRKAKEAILSYRLEKALTKDEIFSIYLNEVFLGQLAYGVKAAAKSHFRKELKDLTIAEAAYLAAMPKKPTYLSNPKNRREALDRQHYVLGQMRKNEMISEEAYKAAKNEKLNIAQLDETTFFQAPYFDAHVVKELEDIFRRQRYSFTPIDPGGYSVNTTVSVKAYEIASGALQWGLREIDKRQGWRGPLASTISASQLLDEQSRDAKGVLRRDVVYTAVVTAVNTKTKTVNVQVGDFRGVINLNNSPWARIYVNKDRRRVNTDPISLIKPGALIEVSIDAAKYPPEGVNEVEKSIEFKLDQTPELEGAFMLINPLTGEVKALVGGYDYRKSVFNRATQALRQPGSSFKPFVYLAAIDVLGFTPATLVPDSPITLVAGNKELWSPRNFDEKFLGPITLRIALEKSRNVVSAYLIDKLNIDPVIEYARKLGITTPIPRELSISLGAPDVKPLELVRAYGVFASGGYLAEPLFVSSIRDRHGKVIYEQFPRQKKVISEESAFLMANIMKGVVERGTATSLRQLERPVAGKTGTTNDEMDAWFIGFTPEWVAGVWVGYDEKRKIGNKETGGRAAAPIFLRFMQEFLAGTPVFDFDIPEGVIPVTINRLGGYATDPSDPAAFVEYFKSGTEPLGMGERSNIPIDYLSNDEF